MRTKLLMISSAAFMCTAIYAAFGLAFGAVVFGRARTK
jgi:hypothetical protein